jgi:phage major head subunit gpT-like protein
MPSPTPNNVTALITTVDTRVGQLWTKLQPQANWRDIAVEHDMGEAEIYTQAWTGRMPKPRPWFGSRVVYEPGLQTYSVTPIPYELTYAIDRFKLSFYGAKQPGNMNAFWRMLPDMVREWVLHPGYEIRDLLEGAGIMTASGRQNGMDGTPHFGTSHPIDVYAPGFYGGNALFSGGNYLNDSRGGIAAGSSGVTIGGALNVETFTGIWEYMQLIPGEDGEALGVMPDTLMVPATLVGEGKLLIEAKFFAPPAWGAFSPIGSQVGAADNMLSKIGVRLMVNPYLKKASDYYVLDCRFAEKPFIWAVHTAPGRITPRINEDDPIVFDSHRYTWGGWDMVTPAWNPAFLSHKSGPTAGQ